MFLVDYGPLDVLILKKEWKLKFKSSNHINSADNLGGEKMGKVKFKKRFLGMKYWERNCRSEIPGREIAGVKYQGEKLRE